MMNRASSSSSDPYLPSSIMSSFVGLDWDTQTNYTQNHTHPIPTNFDPQPPLALPMSSTNFPIYSPQLTEYPNTSFIKREDCGGRIGLNLGQRTYFSSGDELTIDRLFTAREHHHQPPRCQAEGCNADLSGAKHYHRRHKVCEFHSKATVVIARGIQQRFCQQCSRFHVLAEFDESKRSCRKRLADHNRRRRKPQLSTTTTPTTNNSSDKTKHIAHRPSTDSSSKCTTRATTTTTNGGGFGGNQGDQSKSILFRNEPALSLGGVGGTQQVLYNNYQHHHFSPPTFTNNNISFYHQMSLFGSSSNEASQSTGGGSHLSDQAMFEVDFM